MWATHCTKIVSIWHNLSSSCEHPLHPLAYKLTRPVSATFFLSPCAWQLYSTFKISALFSSQTHSHTHLSKVNGWEVTMENGLCLANFDWLTVSRFLQLCFDAGQQWVRCVRFSQARAWCSLRYDVRLGRDQRRVVALTTMGWELGL